MFRQIGEGKSIPWNARDIIFNMSHPPRGTHENPAGTPRSRCLRYGISLVVSEGNHWVRIYTMDREF